MDKSEVCTTPGCNGEAKILCNEHRIGICLTCDCCYHHKCNNHPLLAASQLSLNLKFYYKHIHELQLKAADPIIAFLHPNLGEEIEISLDNVRNLEEKVREMERARVEDRDAIADLDTEIKRNLTMMTEKEIYNQVNHLSVTQELQKPSNIYSKTSKRRSRELSVQKQTLETEHKIKKQKLTDKLQKKKEKIETQKKEIEDLKKENLTKEEKFQKEIQTRESLEERNRELEDELMIKTKDIQELQDGREKIVESFEGRVAMLEEDVKAYNIDNGESKEEEQQKEGKFSIVYSTLKLIFGCMHILFLCFIMNFAFIFFIQPNQKDTLNPLLLTEMSIFGFIVESIQLTLQSSSPNTERPFLGRTSIIRGLSISIIFELFGWVYDSPIPLAVPAWGLATGLILVDLLWVRGVTVIGILLAYGMFNAVGYLE